MKDWGWDERELVRRCKEGSEAGYAELVRQHRPRLYTIAFRLTNDRETAEDVVQEAFLAAFRAIERFEPRPSLAAWLNTITVRLAGKASMRRRDHPTWSLSPISVSNGNGDGEGMVGLADFATVDPTQDPQAAAEAAEVRAAISAAIVALPFNMRGAVVLRHVLGFDYAEAARAMDVPLNTFKSHLLRGTRELRAALLATRLDTGLRGGAAGGNHEAPPLIATTQAATAAAAVGDGDGSSRSARDRLLPVVTGRTSGATGDERT